MRDITMNTTAAERAQHAADLAAARARLAYLPGLAPGSIVTTIVTARTTSSATVRLLVEGSDYDTGPIRDISRDVVLAGWGRASRVSSRPGVVILGVGTDPAFLAVHNLSTALYGDGQVLRHVAL
jgi:hypothetical protein